MEARVQQEVQVELVQLELVDGRVAQSALRDLPHAESDCQRRALTAATDCQVSPFPRSTLRSFPEAHFDCTGLTSGDDVPLPPSGVAAPKQIPVAFLIQLGRLH